jgi:phosphoglycerate dehydrogenase-like enzyme
MRVLAWSPHLTAERAAAAGAEYISTKEELIKASDIVSIHLGLEPSTEGLITASDFALMKPTALFINAARGPIVDEGAMVAALKEEKIRGAGLDVYNVEPLPLDHPIRKLDHVTLSPHLAYVSEETISIYLRRFGRWTFLFRYSGAVP